MSDPVLVVDARGHRCPVPSLRLRKAMETAAPGTRMLLLADDPMARIDAPHMVSQLGGEVISIEVEGGGLAITVSTAGPPAG